MDIVTIVGILEPIASGLIFLLSNKKKSILKELEKCYKAAVEDWDVAPDAKRLARDSMNKHICNLKDFITGNTRGRHPKENELLLAWTEKILLDPYCKSFLLSSKMDYNHNCTEKKFSEIANEICKCRQDISEIAEKVNHLCEDGLFSLDTFWERWGFCPNGVFLNYDIVLSGREIESQLIIGVCKKPSALCVVSSSRSDALAFAAAAILKSRPEDISRSYIVESSETYNRLAKECTPHIIITTVIENAYYPLSKGHSVIQCVAKEDNCQGQNKITLPDINHTGFLKSLEASGIDAEEAILLLRDSNGESSSLRRLLNPNISKPSWENTDNLKYLIPSLLIGSWDSCNKYDKEIVGEMSEMNYSIFEEGVNSILLSDESPLIKVSSIWKIKSPKLLMSRLYVHICQTHLHKFKEILDIIIEDDDPEAIEKKEDKDLHFWKDKRLFSRVLRNGVIQTLTLLSIVGEENGKSSRWIEDIIKEKFNEFGVLRFISNLNNLLWLTEASPSAFIDYIDNDIKNGCHVVNELFEIEEPQYSIGTKVYFAELLTSLECLSWNKNYLPKTTDFLLRFCDYPTYRNYLGKPIDSLYNIYRFMCPQTLVCFEARLEILSKMAKKHRTTTCLLLFMMLEGIPNTIYQSNAQFRWRYSDKIKSPKEVPPIPNNEIIAVTNLLLDNIDMTEGNICNIIELSFNKYMDCARKLILERIRQKSDTIKGNVRVLDCIQKELTTYWRWKSTKWSIAELDEYHKLQDTIANDDIVLKKKKYFDNQLVEEINWRNFDDYPQKVKESREFRKGLLAEILDQKGPEGIWRMSNIAKNKDCVAIALTDIKGDKYIPDVYTLYCHKKLNHNFVCRYLAEVYHKIGYNNYVEHVNQLKAVDSTEIAVLLYAPGVDVHLWNYTKNISDEVQYEYWTKVKVYPFKKEELNFVIDNLRAVNRYSEILHIVNSNEYKTEFTCRQKLSVLFEMMEKGEYQSFKDDIHFVVAILKSVSLPSSPEERNKLLSLELILFEHLWQRMDSGDIHLLNTIGERPELMIEIVCMVFLEDEGYRTVENLTEDKRKQKVFSATCAYNVLHNYHGVPGKQSDGSIDYDFLKSYIKKLYQLAQLEHRLHVIPAIVGKILGNIPENEDYPSDALCEIVEELNDDKVDSEIGRCLYNRRGESIRDPFEGGNIERRHIETFKKYKELSLLRSPRLAKVFDNEIRQYENLAENEDQQATLNKLRI